jgi:hypothetical protein
MHALAQMIRTEIGLRFREDTLTPMRQATLSLVRSGPTTLAAVAKLPGAQGATTLMVTGKNVVLFDGLSWDGRL